MRKTSLIFSIFIANVILIGVFSSAFAQNPENEKRTPIDSYPLPSAAGAARFSLADRWNTTDLSFFIHNCPSRRLDCNQAHTAIREAFLTWAEVSALNFSEVASARQADIELSWAGRGEGLGQAGGTLAFAYFPSYGGDVFFDDAEPWTLYDGGDTDFYVVAVHEIGHALGLDHSNDTNAVMYPYSGLVGGLGADDIAGIQRLYGANEGPEEEVVVVAPPTSIDEGGIETAEGSISNQTYFETWLMDVTAGETVTFNLEALSGNLDTYLILLTPDGETVLLEDDDGLSGTNSALTYTFPTTDEYQIIVTRYDTNRGTSVGDYRLTAIRQGIDTSFSAQTPVIPTGIDVKFSIYNNSRLPICYIWFNTSDNPEWGDERLAANLGSALQSGFYFVWDVPVGLYDVWIEDCNGNYFEQYNIEVYSPLEIEVRKTRLTLNPFVE